MTTTIGTPAPASATATERLVQRAITIKIIFALVMIAGILAIGEVSSTLGLGNWPRAGLALIWLAGARLVWNRLYVPVTLKRSHSLVFSSSPEVIYNAIVPRETTDFYRASVARISAVSATPEIYRFTLRDLCPACPRCGLPHAPTRTRVSYDTEVVEKIENRLLLTRKAGKTQGMRPMSKDECTLWQIEPRGTGSLVVYTNMTVSPLLWYWATSQGKSSGVAFNILTDLQSHLEGTPNAGTFAAAREWLATARAAPEHCQCAKAA